MKTAQHDTTHFPPILDDESAAKQPPKESDIDLSQLANLLVARLKTASLMDLTLWTTENVAVYLNCSARQVADRFSKLQSFPRAIRLPTKDGHTGQPRYKASEVIAWTEKHQDKKRAA